MQVAPDGAPITDKEIESQYESNKGKLKGYGYFEFEREAVEEDPDLIRFAIRCLNGFIVGRKCLKVSRLFSNGLSDTGTIVKDVQELL